MDTIERGKSFHPVQKFFPFIFRADAGLWRFYELKIETRSAA